MSQTARILVVDDEAGARSALAELLSLEGHLVETAADGYQGLSKFAKCRPDLVVTDVKMPGLDRLGLMHKIHEQDPTRPVLLMTAYLGSEAEKAALSAGAVGCVAKPLDFDQLSQVVEHALAEHRLPA